MPSIPELMSPAGHWPQLHAAIEAGADAVYFGLKHFSARAKVGFALGELPKVIRTLHRRGVRGYVTFNTLVFDNELDLARAALIEIARAGCDAVIVQDIGVARMVRATVPDLEIHGSTQMSVTSAEGAELARHWGCRRVVLARELDLNDIGAIVAATDVELEVFVHGALCVSYSGQCFSSEAWGGRSANRGQCAQACRLAYHLVVDGQRKDLGADRYLLSPGDLYALKQIPQLVSLGIACLKIEGRYKDAQYVGLATEAYRRALDGIAQVELSRHDQVVESIDAQMFHQLEQVYSRGLGSWFISGTDHQTVVRARAPRHRGQAIGRVTKVGRNDIEIRLTEGRTLKRGDGIVFDAADRRSPDETEQGGRIYEVQTIGPTLQRVQFGRGDVDLDDIEPGDWIWRTDDPQLTRRLKRLTQPSDPQYRRPVHFEVVAHVGAPLRGNAWMDDGVRVEWVDNAPIEPATNQILDHSTLLVQLERLGDTPFCLGDLSLQTDGRAFVPVSRLNHLRRQLIDQLLAQRCEVVDREVNDVSIDTLVRSVVRDQGDLEPPIEPQIHLLVRTPEQLQGALAARPASITLDYLELYGLRDSVKRIQQSGIAARVASPRILKPSEQKIVRFLLSLECDLLVRSGGLLFELSQMSPARSLPRIDGDFSLNAANAIATASLLELGIDRLSPTHDLNADQIVGLTERIEPERLELVAYHHLPVFHTEHCLFCRFLSTGTDHTNCGHPCEHHQVALRDASGRTHPVMADVGCRNTVFGAEAQTASRFLEHFLDAGIRHFRLEFVHQTEDQVTGIALALADFFQHRINQDTLRRLWNRHSPQGTTDGSLFVPAQAELVQLG